MKRSSFLSITLVTLLIGACSPQSDIEDFIGEYNTAYSQSLKGVKWEGFQRVYFDDLMPIKVKLFQEAQTNVIKGNLRITFNKYVTLIEQFRTEKLYDIQDFRIKNDTLEFSFGTSKIIGQIIKSKEDITLGLEKRFMSVGDLESLNSNPLYLKEINGILYFRNSNALEVKRLVVEHYNYQIGQWQEKLKDPNKRDEAERHISFLRDRFDLMK